MRNRFSATFAPPFKIGAPSIVFGRDLLENVRMLADRVDHFEILLFHTPTLHHFPSTTEIQAVNKMGDSAGLSFSVHLPTSLEIASRHREKRHASLKMVVERINLMNEDEPHLLYSSYPGYASDVDGSTGQYLTTENKDESKGPRTG